MVFRWPLMFSDVICLVLEMLTSKTKNFTIFRNTNVILKRKISCLFRSINGFRNKYVPRLLAPSLELFEGLG